MGRLTGKIALITGGSRGIGRAIAKKFSDEGARVAVLSRSPDGVYSVVNEIQAAGGEALPLIADASNAEDIKAAVEKIVAAYGGLDILVNNAFDATVAYASILDLSIDQFQRNLDMGPIAALRFMQAAYPYLKASGNGRVINFGSMAGITGLAGMGPYNMAKEAIRALTRTAAREWGRDNITVNNLLPVAETWGPEAHIPPASNPLGRYGSPEDDIAPVALFLASQDAQFITGSSLNPDGGAIIDSAR
ncbi:SDR family NAD(P)-dependent oxidoreductase [Neokomagataea thailandica]|uniref:Dehydrogenase n=1 Tax=Neokomagataea tanensis NBRC 106556 TaxID=1223519 RepID=A0ABQ0QGI4_9PROT|nr:MULTISPECIES: SDR family oxidoreductase [Neokomagataea]GBR43970.1 dehydrogenase [Neokomagataea tanensis NBRC 106556]